MPIYPQMNNVVQCFRFETECTELISAKNEILIF
jgi:hypothetical protein